MHRDERVNPTTRSWIPPRTFFTQVRFSRSGNFSPCPGSPAPPSGPENAGQKGQKSRPPGQLPGRPSRPPGGLVATSVEAPWRKDRPGPPAGRKTGPETIRNHGKRRTRTPGAATRPDGAGRRRRPPPARGSPTSSGRRNRTASSRRRRRAAPASPQTSRR